MSLMLSPGVYLRCSENSTENPWNGLAWRPAMNPSTMNLARRSSRATCRITSGFRYFSAVPAKARPPLSGKGVGPGAPAARRGRRREVRPGSARLEARLAAAAVVLGRLGLADLGEQPLDQA